MRHRRLMQPGALVDAVPRLGHDEMARDIDSRRQPFVTLTVQVTLEATKAPLSRHNMSLRFPEPRGRPRRLGNLAAEVDVVPAELVSRDVAPDGQPERPR